MARKKSRRRGLPAPRWNTPPGDRPSELDDAGDPETAWALGESFEAAYDYPAAHHAYQDAMRRHGSTVAAAALQPYAAFLVERYGQFPEVAAWLDTDGWAPDALVEASPELAALIARAADETCHALGPTLDMALAEKGEPNAVERRARQLLDDGAEAQARALLTGHQQALPPTSGAARLLSSLIAAERDAAEAAHEPVRQALQAGDADAARRALENLAPRWGADGLHRSLAQQLEALQQTLDAEALRAALSDALDRDALDEAIALAEQVVAGSASHAADLATLDALRARQAEGHARQALVSLRAVSGDGAAVFSALIAHREALLRLQALVDPGDPRLQALAPPVGRADAAVLIDDAAERDGELLARGDAADHLAAVDAIGRRADGAARDDEEAAALIRAGLDALPAAWRALGPARRARAWLDERDAAARRAHEEQLAGRIRMHLISGDLQAAQAQVDAAFDAHPDAGEALRLVRDDVRQAADREARRAALVAQIAQALGDGALFVARRAARQLGSIDSDAADEARPLQRQIDEAMAEQLSAKPVPPFAAKLGQGAIAFGVVGGRLLLVQGATWLAVNLETGGLRPYQLPEGWALDARPAPRIHDEDGSAVVVGRSAGRLVKLRARPDEAPRVIEARDVASVLGPDEVLSALAVEPDADPWTALGRHRDTARVPTVHALDPEDLSARDSRRIKPAIWHLCGVRHGGGRAIAASRPNERKPGQWAIALLDAGGKVRERFEQAALQEPVAYPTEAVAWPEESLVFARYTWLDMFDPERVHAGASLLVLREGRVVFASADLRRRFAPTDPIVVDGGWAFDRASGRLWFAARHRDDEGADAMLLGVQARRLRADPPTAIPGARAVIGIEAFDDGAVALFRSHEGGFGVARLRVDGGDITMHTQKLPVASAGDA